MTTISLVGMTEHCSIAGNKDPFIFVGNNNADLIFVLDIQNQEGHGAGQHHH